MHINVVRGKSPKLHFIRPEDANPMCGNPVKGLRRLPGEDVMICTKANYDEGGKWCYGCIAALRNLIKADVPLSGRPTHIRLSPMLKEVTEVSGAPEHLKDAVLVTFTYDRKNYEDPNYGYCNECRQPYHAERDDNKVTDWTR